MTNAHIMSTTRIALSKSDLLHLDKSRTQQKKCRRILKHVLKPYDSHSPRGVLRISSDGDDRRIFLGLIVLIPGFFWVGKFGKYFFGWLDLST